MNLVTKFIIRKFRGIANLDIIYYTRYYKKHTYNHVEIINRKYFKINI